MKQVVKLEKRMFNKFHGVTPRILIHDDWLSNGDWMMHRSKCDYERLVPFEFENLTDSVIDGVLNRTVDESIRFYRTKERADVNGRQLVLFKAVDGKERMIQLRYVRYFGLKTLYSKDSEDDSMLWTEDKKFFVMPVKK